MSQADSPNTMSPSRRALLAGAPAVAVAALAAGAVVNSFATVPVAPAALAPAVAPPSPDAGLLQLFDEYLAARSDYRRLSRKERRLSEKHDAATPLPDGLRVQPGDAELGLPEPETEHVERAFGYGTRIWELQRPEWPVVETIEPPEGLQFYRESGGFATSWTGGGEVVHYDPPSAAARARADEIIKAHAKWKRKRRQEPATLRAVSRQRDTAFKLADRLQSKIDRTRALTIAGLAVKAQVAAIEGEDDTQFADTTLASILRDMRALARIGA
jgi:hypothetical protein